MGKFISLSEIKVRDSGYTSASGQSVDEDNQIRAMLGRIQPQKRVAHNVVIKCPFHNDTSPSLNVNGMTGLVRKGRKIPVGWYSCWSCGARGSYNDLAEKLNLPKVNRDPLKTDTHAQLQSMSELKNQSGVSRPRTMEYWLKKLKCEKPTRVRQEWRGFSPEFLAALGCVQVTRWYRQWLFLPAYDNKKNKLWGAIAARWAKEDGKLSYINGAGGWISSHGLWPLHAIVPAKPCVVFLVEGPRDAMRLLRLGIPCVAILGTQTVNEEKINTLLSSLERLDLVVMCFDGDEAGKKCTAVTRTLLRGKVRVVSARLYDYAERKKLKKVDPMSAPLKWVQKIWTKYGDPKSRKRLIKHLKLES